MTAHHARTRHHPGHRRFPRLIALLVAPVVLAWVPAPSVRAAGPVIDLSRALAAGPAERSRPNGPGRFLLTSVRDEHDPMWLWATRSLVDPGWRPGARAAGPLNTLAQMQQAEAAAWAVAVGQAAAWAVAVGQAATLGTDGTVTGPAEGAPGRPMPEIDTHGVTGPSGGLMLALAFTDSLGPGDLTGGRTIAGTGTIDRDGDVGPIGSVTYKVRGAAAAGATVFFVPADDAGEAGKAAPATMRVVPVATYADALGWLCAGSSDHACATTSTGQPG